MFFCIPTGTLQPARDASIIETGVYSNVGKKYKKYGEEFHLLPSPVLCKVILKK